MTGFTTVKTDVKIGFVRLGNIGLPMCEALSNRVTNEIVVFDTNAAAVSSAVAKLRCTAAASVAEVGARCSVVCIVVGDEPALNSVVAGADGLLEHMAPGGTLLVHSTVGARTVIAHAQLARQRSIQVIDAPVSGAGRRERRSANSRSW